MGVAALVLVAGILIHGGCSDRRPKPVPPKPSKASGTFVEKTIRKVLGFFDPLEIPISFTLPVKSDHASGTARVSGCKVSGVRSAHLSGENVLTVHRYGLYAFFDVGARKISVDCKANATLSFFGKLYLRVKTTVGHFQVRLKILENAKGRADLQLLKVQKLKDVKVTISQTGSSRNQLFDPFKDNVASTIEKEIKKQVPKKLRELIVRGLSELNKFIGN